MTVATGSGRGNTAVQQVFSLGNSFYFISNAIDTTFTATSTTGLGSVTINGSGLTYSSFVSNGTTFYQLVGGTITSVIYSQGASNQTWTGFNVSAAAAFNALGANDSTFGNLFFGGNDTFNWTPANTSSGNTLAGYDGNDTFNLSGYSSINLIDGGNGSDTINLSGGLGAQYGSFTGRDSSSGNSADFSVTSIEILNLAAGSNYTIIAAHDVVAAGQTLTVDGSHLGPSDQLIFDTNTGGQAFWVVTGNLTLLGGAGNDILEGGTGTNTFNGGGGNNTVEFMFGQQRFGDGATGVTADLSNPGLQNFGAGFGTGTFTNIQNLTGTPWGDTLTGDNGDNIIDSGGDPFSAAGGGSDTMSGGGGNDTFIIHGGVNVYHTTVDGGTGTDTVVLNHPRSTYTLSVSNGIVTLADTTGPFSASTIALTNVEYAQFTDQTLPLFGPVVTTATVGAVRNQTLPLPSLFSVTDALGLPITEYQLWDSTANPLSGSFVVNGVVQAAHTIIDIPASQLSQVSFVTNKVSDDLQIRAYDGTYWSAADNAAWSPFTISVPNAAPVVSTTSQATQHGHTFALSSLMSVSDADGDPITAYEIWDSVNDPSSGHFVVNGVVEPERTVIDITAAQLAQTSYVAGAVGENLQIRAFDGIDWSAPASGAWSPFTISVPPNHAPVVSTTSIAAQRNQTFALSSLMSASDADGDPITAYEIWDSVNDPSSGHFVVNGVVEPERTVIDITAAQLAQATYVAGKVSENLQIRAFDGFDWSAPASGAWSPFTISVPANHAPVVATTSQATQHGHAFALSSLMSVSDADGDPITAYEIWDSVNDPSSGHFVVNGVVQPERTVIDITAAQLAQTSYVAGAVGENLQIRAFDGIDWSAPASGAWSPFTISVPTNHAPVVATTSQTTQHGHTFALSGLMSVSDADGDPITEYQLWDSVDDPSTGHFVVNGVAQQGRTVVDITVAQLAQTTYVAGAVGENLQIRAFDGYDWSAPASGAWAPFTITVPTNHAPVLLTTSITIPHGQSVAASSLFTVSDADGDPITEYQLWDSVDDPSSGHFVVNGVVQQGRTVIDLTPSQLAQTTYVAGAVGENLQIRAFDGYDWSAPASGAWAPFTITVPTNHAPVLLTTSITIPHGQSVAASSLFTVSDADGDPITKYQLWDSVDDPSSGHFVVNGVVQQGRTVIDLTPSQLAQTTYVAGAVGENLQIRAFDGYDWSAPASGAWAPFTITVPTNHAPVLLTTSITIPHGQSVAASSLFTVSDADGDPITEYQLWDSVDDPSSGHFVVNGVVQQGRTVIDLTPSQLAQTSYVAGAVGENLQIRAFDGYDWSAPASGAWAPFHITVS